MIAFIKKNLHIIFLVFVCLIFFYRFFLFNKYPIPSDIIPGAYYPWHQIDYPNYPAGVPIKNPQPSDVVSLTLPLRKLAIDILKTGHLPLWNHYVLSGSPLASNFQSATYYPLNILYAISSNFYVIWSIQIIFQHIFLAVFMYLFLRDYKLSKLVSIFGALTWAFTGFNIIWSSYNTVVQAVAFLPLILLSIKNINKGPKYKIYLSLSIFCAISAGNPPIALINMVFAAMYTLYLHHKSIRKMFLSLIFALLAIIASLPILMPSLKISSVSVRPFDQVALQNNIKYLPMIKTITSIIPNFFGHPSTGNSWQKAGMYDNLNIFIGIIPITLLIFKIISKKKFKHQSFFLISIAISFLLMTKNPISIYIGQIKFLGLNSMVMTRLTYIISFSISFLSSIGLDQLLKTPKQYQTKIKIAISLIIFTIIIFYVFLSSDIFYLGNISQNNPLTQFHSDNIYQHVNEAFVAIKNSLPSLAILFGFTFSLLFIKRNKKIFIFLTIFLTLTDLYFFFNKYITFNPADFLYPNTPTTNFLQTSTKRFVRENAEIIPSNMWLPYQLKSVTGYDTTQSLRYNQFLNHINGYTLDQNISRYAEVTKYNQKYLDFLSVEYIAALTRSQSKLDSGGTLSCKFNDIDFEPVFKDGPTSVLKNLNPLDIVNSVSDYQMSTSAKQTKILLSQIDLTQTVILEQQPKYDQYQKTNIEKFISQTNGFIFNTYSDQPTLISTSIPYYPGWTATSNDQNIPVNIGNHAFISFELPPGQNQVDLSFQKNMIWLLLITLISIPITIVAAYKFSPNYES